MKQTYLKFPARRVSYLPKMVSRRMRLGTENHNVAYKSDGDTPTVESEAEAIAKIGTQVTKFTDLLGDKADKTAIEALVAQVADLSKNIETMKADDISKMLKDINDGNEKLWKQVVELQEKAAEEKETAAKEGNQSKGAIVEVKELEALVKATFGEKTERGYTGEKIKGAFGVIKMPNATKAALNFGYDTFFQGGSAGDTDFTAFTGRYVDPTLYQRKRKRNLILDNFRIGTIGVPYLIYLIKIEDGDDVNTTSGDSGSAAWILSGEAKPKRSFKVATGKAEAKKVAIFGTVEDKLLRDVASLENWIREDFMDEMKEEINDGLLNNNPAVNDKAPLGLKTNAIQYTPTPAYNNVFTANTSNYIDQLFAIFALMAYNKEEAGQAFVSSDVYYRIMHLKDTDQRYLNNNLVYTNALGQLFIAGVPIIWADQEDIPSTNVLVTAVDLGFKMYAYGPMVFESGLNGEDFRYDRTSYRGYQEFLSFIPENRENSVLYDTWANVKAAIEA